MRDRLNAISPSLCVAKWKMLTLHLTTGNTHSCHHPVAHPIPLESLSEYPSRLHNTDHKIQERKQMRDGERPSGCQYCWNVEDAAPLSGSSSVPSSDSKPHLSDRHFRSSEWWAKGELEKISSGDAVEKQIYDQKVIPSHVEVNFNQACNLKCIYCSPHLSTEWQREVEKFGPFNLEGHLHHDFETLKQMSLFPLQVPTSENPYVQTFWKWWPELYPELKIFRMTGGEPLLDANTWKVMDYILAHPNPSLELSITSNLCPPKPEILQRFIQYLQRLENEKAIKSFSLYVSCDSVGEQAEYIRSGMNFNLLKKNIHEVMRNTKTVSIGLINTVTALSLPKLTEYLKWVLELRQTYSSGAVENVRNIWLDFPLLVYPTWLNARLLSNSKWENTIAEAIDFMQLHPQKTEGDRMVAGFRAHEVTKLKRDLGVIQKPFDPETQMLNQKKFRQYVDELDRRRGTDFRTTFPELEDFYSKPD
ncbi:twitch domain-containing radical SAM protein [Pseudobdellovibrio exovorus]|nr:twitch domain-containing radical SAM protein [Pseudobdellovibrio exovorus]